MRRRRGWWQEANPALVLARLNRPIEREPAAWRHARYAPNLLPSAIRQGRACILHALIDLASTISSSDSTGSMSKIPVSSRYTSTYNNGNFGIKHKTSKTSLRSSYDRSMPDLTSDLSDSISTQSSGPPTPPSVSPPSRKSRDSFGKQQIVKQHTGSRRRSTDVDTAVLCE